MKGGVLLGETWQEGHGEAHWNLTRGNAKKRKRFWKMYVTIYSETVLVGEL